MSGTVRPAAENLFTGGGSTKFANDLLKRKLEIDSKWQADVHIYCLLPTKSHENTYGYI